MWEMSLEDDAALGEGVTTVSLGEAVYGGCEQVDADGVVKEQIRGMLTQEISGIFRKQRVGND